MTRRISPIALCAIIATLIATAVAAADPAGKSTLDETIDYAGGSAYAPLMQRPGGGDARPEEPREGRRRAARSRRKTITFFGQLTDPQIMDEMSPARGELIDRVGSPFESSWRPQEALGAPELRPARAKHERNRTSPFRQGNGKRARMKFVLNTGDMADSAQLNETRSYIQVLEGGQVDPFSGKPISATNPCPQADEQAEVDALNAAVAARQLHGRAGLRRLARRARRPLRRLLGPGRGAAIGVELVRPVARATQGLLERAQQAFTAEGLKTPWYTTRGNHDMIWQGTFRAVPTINFLTTACIKVFPNDKFDPERYKANPGLIVQDLADPAFVNTQLGEARLVPPDPDRRFLRPGEYKTLHGNADNGHGFKFVSRAQNRGLERRGRVLRVHAQRRPFHRDRHERRGRVCERQRGRPAVQVDRARAQQGAPQGTAR